MRVVYDIPCLSFAKSKRRDLKAALMQPLFLFNQKRISVEWGEALFFPSSTYIFSSCLSLSLNYILTAAES